MSIFDNNQKSFRLTRRVTPKRVLYKGKFKKIKKYDDELIIENYRVVINKTTNRILKIILEGNIKHPNADPVSGEVCLPKTILGYLFTETNMKKVDKLLETFNLMDCYQIPYGLFRVEGGLKNGRL